MMGDDVRRRRLMPAWLALAVWLIGNPVLSQPDTQGVTLALVGGRIYRNPVDAPIQDGVVIIADGTIVRVGRRTSVPIPERAQVIDCRGLTLTSGFWNSHVHFLQRKWSDASQLPATELSRQFFTDVRYTIRRGRVIYGY